MKRPNKRHGRTTATVVAGTVLAATCCTGLGTITAASTVSDDAECVPGTTGRIAFMLKQQTAYRYLNADIPFFRTPPRRPATRSSCSRPRTTPSAQVSQAENVLTQGVDAIVIQPVDFNVAGRIADLAREAGVPLASYDDLILNSEHDAFIGRDPQGGWRRGSTRDARRRSHRQLRADRRRSGADRLDVDAGGLPRRARPGRRRRRHRDRDGPVHAWLEDRTGPSVRRERPDRQRQRGPRVLVVVRRDDAGHPPSDHAGRDRRRRDPRHRSGHGAVGDAGDRRRPSVRQPVAGPRGDGRSRGRDGGRPGELRAGHRRADASTTVPPRSRSSRRPSTSSPRTSSPSSPAVTSTGRTSTRSTPTCPTSVPTADPGAPRQLGPDARRKLRTPRHPEPLAHGPGCRQVFGQTIAVDDLSFDLDDGEIVALLGENGAGKSTIIGVLAGLFGQDFDGETDGRRPAVPTGERRRGGASPASC